MLGVALLAVKIRSNFSSWKQPMYVPPPATVGGVATVSYLYVVIAKEPVFVGWGEGVGREYIVRVKKQTLENVIVGNKNKVKACRVR